jgi:hypothetical protein
VVWGGQSCPQAESLPHCGDKKIDGTKPISHKPLIINCQDACERRFARDSSSFDPEMELEDGIVIFGVGALADGQGLRELGALPREGLRDAQSASQDIAMQNKSAGVGSALVGAGHGDSSFVREIAKNRHSFYLGFRIATANPGTGDCRMYLFDF